MLLNNRFTLTCLNLNLDVNHTLIISKVFCRKFHPNFAQKIGFVSKQFFACQKVMTQPNLEGKSIFSNPAQKMFK